MRKFILVLALAVSLVLSVMAYTLKQPATPKGKTITQVYWVEPTGQARYIDRVITRVVLDDGNIYERTDFSNKDVNHQFTLNGYYFQTTDDSPTATQGNDWAPIDARAAKRDCLARGMVAETIAGYETFHPAKSITDLGSEFWVAPELHMTPLRIVFKNTEFKQGIETVSITDGVDLKLLEIRDQQAAKPQTK